MTYAEFKNHMAAAGVRDDDVIGYIEIDPLPGAAELLIERRPAVIESTVVNVVDKFD